MLRLTVIQEFNNVIETYNLACRDDMESIGYVIMHLLRGELPWSGLKAKNDKEKQ